MASLLDLTVQGDVATISGESKLPQVKLMSPLELYRLWERQNWASHQIDLEQDRRDWEAMDESERDSMLWGLSAFFVGEERVTNEFSGLVMAAELHRPFQAAEGDRTRAACSGVGGHCTGGGSPVALAGSAGSHSHARHAWLNAERAKSSARPWGSELARTSSQSSTNSPSSASHRAASGDTVTLGRSSGAGKAKAKNAAFP